MLKRFYLQLKEIQPSQLYICDEKLADILKILDEGREDELDPIPIKILDGEKVSTDGHTRMFALYLRGTRRFLCEWEDTEMDWDAYRICVHWCKEEGITSTADFDGRVINWENYQKLWLDRCRMMQEELDKSRLEK
jgi:hypothetical protein